VVDFVPRDFDVPRRLETPQFVLEPLGPEHNDQDYDAWTSSGEHIHATPGWEDSSWPREMTPDENRADLQRHAGDFRNRTGFTYTVLDPASRDVIGCVYIYPLPDSDYDTRVLSWVRASHAQLDTPLWRVVSEWLASDWPFGRVEYAPRTVTSSMRATLHTDGAARRKSAQPTGPAGIGAVLRSESGEVIGKIATFIGIRTNNEAEYIALIEGLQMALDCGVTDLEAYIDSPVVAGHLLKGHQVKADRLSPLVKCARELLKAFSTRSLTEVRRGQNADADELANQGIDDAIRQFPCPSCGTKSGEPCIGLRAKHPVSIHAERVVAAGLENEPGGYTLPPRCENTTAQE
jgi:ribonuclease HI